MKYLNTLLFTCVFALSAVAQMGNMKNPVKWESSIEQTENGTYVLSFKADIEEGWKVYANDIPTGGPVPTTLYIDDQENFELVGELDQKGRRKGPEYDNYFDMEISYYKKKYYVKQEIKALTGGVLKGELEYMTCNDQECLPPTTVPFSFEVKAYQDKSDASEGATDKASNGIQKPVVPEVSFNKISDNEFEVIVTSDIQDGWWIYANDNPTGGPIPAELVIEGIENIAIQEIGKPITKEEPLFNNLRLTKYKHDYKLSAKFTTELDTIMGRFTFQTCNNSMCLPPDDVEFAFDVNSGEAVVIEKSATPTAEAMEMQEKLTRFNAKEPVSKEDLATGEQKETEEEKSSLWTLFLLGFGGGLIALLTPCVFPMIPMTVTFFTKTSKSKRAGIINAITYGAFIFIIYLILSTPFHLLDNVNPDILSNISTNPILNIVFFAIFVFFAGSFFGYYELALPGSWSNKADTGSSKGGLLGTFFMALTLAIVSFSCTGPILGSLLVGSISSDGGAIQLTFGMGGFGLALALPFALFAAFPGWMNSLPKSGGWLNVVKVVLAFLELGLALKFLSNADLVNQWGLIKREVFIGIWVILGIGLAAYLFGFIRFKHDYKGEKIGIGRKVFGVASLAFVIYIFPGVLPGKPAELSLIAGFPPPTYYSIYEENKLHHYLDYFEAIEVAKAENKPLFVDFTGDACVNCRKMEENVFTKEGVKAKMDSFVVVSLYVDRRVELEGEEQVEVTYPDGATKMLRNIGNKWAFFQAINAHQNTQPQYVLIDPKKGENGMDQVLNFPVSYTPDVEEFEAFLSQGLKNFN